MIPNALLERMKRRTKEYRSRRSPIFWRRICTSRCNRMVHNEFLK